MSKEHPFVSYVEEIGVHVSYVREMIPGRIYEVVAMRRNSEDTMEFVHNYIDLVDYSEKELDEILRYTKYYNFENFVCSYIGRENLIIRNGRVDRNASAAWNVDYYLLMSIVVETVPGRTVSTKRAKELVSRIIGEPVN